MPIVDESLSWGRVEIPYITEFASHRMRFHCREMDASGNWTVPVGGETTVQATVGAFLEALSPFLATGTSFSQFSVYKNNPSPDPAELWLLQDVPILDPLPAGNSFPADTVTFNFRTPLNRIAKFVTCDTNVSVDVPWVIPNSGATVAIEAFRDYVIGNNNIVTIDGQNITALYSVTGTLNDTLERKYGKAARTFP